MKIEWKKLVESVAPMLGTALGGPLGGLAVQAIGNALGLSDATEEKISIALAGAKPEDLLKLKAADQQFFRDMKALDIDMERINAANTDSARTMQVATKSKVPAMLAILVTIGFFGILIGMMTGSLAVSEKSALLIMLGALGAAWGSVINFYFGSSNGSQAKDMMMRK